MSAAADAPTNGAAPAATLDGLKSFTTSLGIPGADPRLDLTPAVYMSITEAQINALYQSSWCARRVVDDLPGDATRKWFELTIGEGDPELQKRVMARLDKWGAKTALCKAMRIARKDGGAAIFVGDKSTGPIESSNGKSRGKIRKLKVLSRYRFQPPDPKSTFNLDPDSDDFGMPAFLVTREGKKIDTSRLLIMRGLPLGDDHPTAPPGISQDDYFWGQGVIALAWEPLRTFISLWEYAESNFARLTEPIYKMLGFKRLLAEGDEAVIKAALAAYHAMRSAFNLSVIDKDDDLDDRTVEMAGFWDGLVRAAEQVCGATKFPITKLFGAPPAGLTSDDASGERNWYDLVRADQNDVLLPAIRALVLRALEEEGVFFDEAADDNPEIDIAFVELGQETAGERAQRFKARLEAAKIAWDLRAVSHIEVRRGLGEDADNWIPLDEEETARLEAEEEDDRTAPEPDPAPTDLTVPPEDIPNPTQ